MKVYLLCHKFDTGDSVEVYADKAKALEGFRAILQDYMNEGLDIDVDVLNGSQLYEATDGDCDLSIVAKEIIK